MSTAVANASRNIEGVPDEPDHGQQPAEESAVPDISRSEVTPQTLALGQASPYGGVMPPVTFRSRAVTELAALGAVRAATGARLRVGMRVPVVRALHTAPMHKLSCPPQIGRDPPAESLHFKTTARAKLFELRPFFFFRKGRP
ncbi:hypothetical protein [Micromonospora sp. LH3U1]|uniref:hypothetical protein n=1 Tax=Micromonospora sp. LH3U1 TaxID=3018339 RepID=UPI00234B2609|nr:hypothetical protein [Micromonospora sp. LH3U1]WCN79445.1 hypothetical protein PCA76_20760 [Micromonospora sp. LH3U1]